MSLITEKDQANPEVRTEKYNLLKNLGWLCLRQKHYVDADQFLQEAIALDSERAAAHCLRAQVLAGLEQPKQAIPLKSLCLPVALPKRLP